MDKYSYVEIRKARGLVNILKEREDRLAVVPDTEIESVRAVVRSQTPILPYPYLCEGQKVRIVQGPLVNVEGVLIQTKPDKGLLVISIDLLQRSIAIEVDCTIVESA
jgi:transcription antitermination factor NusG